MIEPLALRMAQHIKRVVPDHPSSVPVLKHALSAILNLVFITGLTIAISVFIGRTREVVTIMVAFAFLRQMTGGIHLKSGMWCVAVSTLLFTGLSFIELDYNWTTGATLVSMLLILIFAPAGIEKQTRIPPRYFPLLRSGAFIAVSLNLWIADPFIAISFFAQSLSLINIRRWKTS
ncbi:accessory gene regulator ArgB-like protein [Paenibacillus farraposensis]|uniref:Accessory gene regulator ArgB-like protein n=1 Tax=Paenibacillus farraposensis TaxID=2807095 RepID=A0ABW4DEM2_9BACL|nr:accessory gene regulator B family protein [Paenibacillus farraposensis]MCC3379876.1 accessory gene regulator B family protein [Paenibacillus farraposensis]